jgi:hypothetical protein
VGHVPNKWKGINPINTLGGMQNMLCLSEQGLYFFLGRSDKDAALPFQMWIADKVIPSIRKTGHYGISGQNILPGSKRPLLEDVRGQFEEENVKKDIEYGLTDPALLQFVLENLEYSPRVNDFIPVETAYKLYLTYPAENPLPIEQFAIDVCGVAGSNMNICLSKGRLTHCKFKESVPILRLT